MPKRQKNGELPLPDGWDFATDYDGKVFYIDHLNQKTTWVDPRDRFTKPESFADCIGDELPLGWEETYDSSIGRYFINHIKQFTQIEDPRQEWKSVQEKMLREYLNSAQDALEAKKEICTVKQDRLLLAQEEFNLLNALAASRTSLYSSSSSISTRVDPELLRADINVSKDRVERLKRELAQINSEISHTQRGVDKLYSVELKLSQRENGCFNIKEVQEIKDQIMNIQKSLVYGEKQKEDLKKSLVQLKCDLTKLHLCEESPDASAFNLAQDRICVASQTDLCSDILPVGARLAEMAKMKLQYDEWKKRIKLLQQQLADHVDKIEPGQIESDKDRILLIQEKEQYLKELRCLSLNPRSKLDSTEIQKRCQKLEQDLRNAFKASNQCIADRLRLQEDKELLLQQLQEALHSTQLLEDRIKSASLGSTFSISSGSSLGSLSTASSRGSLSGLSFTDIYGDPLSTDPLLDVTDLNRRMRLSQPLETAISPRSSLSTESPKKLSDSMLRMSEPMYENIRSNPTQVLYSNVLDCVELEERLNEQLISQAPLSTIYEKSSILDLPHAAFSHMSSASNSRSVSAAVSNESVAGDSGVFEASRALLQNREAAQVQIGLKYSKSDFVLHISIEQARNLTTFCIPTRSHIYFKAALLPGSLQQIFRTETVLDFRKPVFNNSFQIPISLNKIYTKTLQINLISVLNRREECIGCAQVSLAEFNTDDVILKWYNILSFRFIQQPEEVDNAGVCKEESSDESTTTSQTSTLTRNQGQVEMELQSEEKSCTGQSAVNCCADNNRDNVVSVNDDEADDSSTEDEDRVRSTEEMIAAYMSEVQNFTPCCVDKETNTECAFLPEKSRLRHLDRASTSKEEDDRLVKRSQTFSPSAVVSKNRYICRLNRSDSDSAMHFGGITTPRPFQRGSIERRSLRYQHGSKLPKAIMRLHSTTPITSLDLELDLQAQQTKLETLNDEITRLNELKARLEKALDSNDVEVATWALENEEFQKLVDGVDVNSPENRKLQKLLHKTSKEVYKLRKTRLATGQPDLVSFREKMAFFTKNGMSVPELPPLEDGLLVEKESKLDNVITPKNMTPNSPVPPPQSTSATAEHSSKDNNNTELYKYTVDRNVGVEV